MRPPATSLLALLLACSAQAAVPYAKLRQVADLVSCQCGCSYTVGSCNMLNCHFRDPILKQISEGLEAGEQEEALLEAVYEQYGPETRVQPREDAFGMLGWTAPFALLIAGLAAMVLVVRRWRAHTSARSATQRVPDQVLDHYRAQIEDDLGKLD